jgi:sec-independent protein translocase protein TatA
MSGLSDLLLQVGVGGFEWVIIIVIVVVLIFGVKKIPELARSFGKASSEYEKAKIEAKNELRRVKTKDVEDVEREKLESIAETLGIDYTNKNDEELRIAIDAEINRSKNQP